MVDTFDKDLVSKRLGHGDLNQFEIFGRVIANSFHLRGDRGAIHVQ